MATGSNDQETSTILKCGNGRHFPERQPQSSCGWDNTFIRLPDRPGTEICTPDRRSSLFLTG
ncbi:hypothetical protein AA0229_0830 [Gluconobacter cerinus NRIC 0229]|uniref:Uncharacterized protein n=1 Tax=Gluconobacter cerinus TaxID=38307 RepID=A0AAV5NGF0_9PROT|nr:hypothetical protein AA0229_0830 [Gluconobacter cerinus NRIC 0229]GLQ63024.1 hypothetical protein GCM10007867_18690 [Gluconobacter cerinus]